MNRRQLIKASFPAALGVMVAPVVKLVPARFTTRVIVTEIDLSVRRAGFGIAMISPPLKGVRVVSDGQKVVH